MNDGLRFGEYEIQYIVRLDEYGNVVEKLFDRERDMNTMPELEDGMFVEVQSDFDELPKLGVIVRNKIIYQKGGWDVLSSDDADIYVKDDIVAVYGNCGGFNAQKTAQPIWEKK